MKQLVRVLTVHDHKCRCPIGSRLDENNIHKWPVPCCFKHRPASVKRSASAWGSFQRAASNLGDLSDKILRHLLFGRTCKQGNRLNRLLPQARPPCKARNTEHRDCKAQHESWDSISAVLRDPPVLAEKHAAGTVRDPLMLGSTLLVVTRGGGASKKRKCINKNRMQNTNKRTNKN